MKQFLLTILLLSLFFAFAGSVQAQINTIVDFPDLPGAPDPTSGIPQLIKYIFIFSLGIVGLIGMVAILMGGFSYVTSAGNPQKAADGKNQILSALLGLLLILGSWVLLNLINPDLLKLGVKKELGGIKYWGATGGESVSISGLDGVCRLVGASWDKEKINAGGSATFTLVASKECGIEIQAENFFKKTELFLEHENPGLYADAKALTIKDTCGSGFLSPSELSCNVCVNIASLTRKKTGNNIEFSYLYTFNKKCIPGGGINTARCYRGDSEILICNFNKSEEETFYLKGEITTGDQSGTQKQRVPKLEIKVRDLNKDNTCCR